MAAIVEVLSAPFFHKPVSPNSYQEHWIVGICYKFHTMTGSLLFAFSCFVFAREFMNDHIHCIQDGADAVGSKISDIAFDSYCYISNTFTLPKILTENFEEFDAPYPGIGPIGYNDRKELKYHNYYMWVPYLLLFQSVTFFIPILLHKFLQEGKIQLLLQGIHNVIPFKETREDKYGDVKDYLRDYWHYHDWWAAKLFFCDILNLVNIVLNILFTNWYLSKQFLTYGINSLAYIFSNPDTRGLDPFNMIFPKMTKCTMDLYGPSGTVQNYDALCILPINVMNEKLYLVAWFVLMSLGLFTSIHHLISSMIILTPFLRKAFLSLYIMRGRHDLQRKLHRICDLISYGDWLVLYMLAKNTNQVTFSEIIMTIKPPGYRHDLDESDLENVMIERVYLNRTESREKLNHHIEN